MANSKTKTISAYAVIDWRKGSTRTRKSKPKQSELGTNELLAELKFKVRIPEVGELLNPEVSA